MIKGLAGLAVVQKVAQGLAGTFSQAFTGAGEFEQLKGGVEKIFDQANTAQIFKDAQDAYMDLNMSANDYLESINKVGATFAQTMGDQKGYDTARTGMKAIADYASGTGANLDVLNEKYQLITRSSGSYLSIADQFAGILPQTKEDFLEQAKAAGFLKDEYEDLKDVPIDEYQEAVTKMLEKGVEDMGLLGNTTAETKNTVTGSIAGMKAAWENWLTALSDPDADLDALTDNLIDMVASVVRNCLPVVVEMIKSLFTRVPQAIMDALNEQFGSMAITIPGIDFTALQEAISPVVDAFGNLKQVVVDAASGIWERLQPAFVELAPYVSELALALLPALSGALQWLAGVLDIVFTAFQVLWDILAPIVLPDLERHLEAISTGLTVLGGYLDWIGTQFQTASDTARSAWEKAKSFFSALPGEIIGFFSGIGSGIGAFFDEAVRWAQSAFQSLVDFVSGIPGQIVGYFAGLGGQITAAIGSIHFPQPNIWFEHIGVGDLSIPIPHVTWAASGGIFAPNAPTLLGLGDNRRYDEAAIPLSPSVLAGIGAGIAQYSGGVGGGVNVYINNAQVNSDEEISNSVYNILSVLQRRGRM